MKKLNFKKAIRIYSKTGSVKPTKGQSLKIYKGKYKGQMCTYEGAKKSRCLIKIPEVKQIKLVYPDILGIK